MVAKHLNPDGKDDKWLSHRLIRVSPNFINEMELEAGYIVPIDFLEQKKITETNEIKIDKLRGEYAKFILRGPYEKLPESWKAIQDWAKEKNAKLVNTLGACIQEYVCEKPGEWQTDLYHKLDNSVSGQHFLGHIDLPYSVSYNLQIVNF